MVEIALLMAQQGFVGGLHTVLSRLDILSECIYKWIIILHE
ncbi:unnamed protein product [uncultured virus]|nr:unnamed protein product [uncultured virus]